MSRRIFSLTMKDLRIAKQPKIKLDPMVQKEFNLYLEALRVAGMDSQKVPRFFEEALENAMDAAKSRPKKLSLRFHINRYLERK